MNQFAKHITSDKILLLSFSITLLLMALTIILILFFYNNLPPFLPLFNQMPWGVARLGSKEQIFIPLVLTLVITLTNTILGKLIYPSLPLVSRMLAVTMMIIALFVFLFTIRTIQIIL